MSRDRSRLHPEVQAAVARLEAACAGLGLRICFTDCVRTQAEQQALYEQGRTKPGSIVTNVRYPHSAHNWGVAVDFCENVRGQEYDDAAFFRQVGELAKQFGFTWGGDWRSPDRPHLEYAKFMPESSTAWLQATYGTPERFRATWQDAAIDYAAQVCERLGLAQETRTYLDGYRYANDLWEKIWKAVK